MIQAAMKLWPFLLLSLSSTLVSLEVHRLYCFLFEVLATRVQRDEQLHEGYVIGEPKIDCEADKITVYVKTRGTFMQVRTDRIV